MKGAGRWALSILLLGGCHAAPMDRPPVIRYGEDACAHCRMVISEARFAATWTSPDGRVTKFDDLGCLLQALAAMPGPIPRILWGHDYASEAWLNLAQATVVLQPDLITPMGSRLAAFASPAAAQAFAESGGGQTAPFDAIHTLPWRQARERQPKE